METYRRLEFSWKFWINFFLLKDTGDLRSQMANYYTVILFWLNSNSNFLKYFATNQSKTAWSEIYTDFSLNITMATAATPCFSTEGDLLGVSGVDSLVSDLLQ